ncbi:MAG: 3-deoxy-manno-octulosonate cytidylyltransferase [Acidobacteria bacterium]|nr:3-deoxy-manno-octulosonate cytidylyltransferase [Acidobacteriota bacterium]
MLESIGVIPARYGSTRFPGKVLATLRGIPLIQHVYERTRRCRHLDRVVVATDDERVRAAVWGFGGEAEMTSSRHPTGTDRVAEIAARIPADLYLNVQGDEPLVEPDDLSRLVAAFRERPGLQMATLRAPLPEPARLRDPNVVKVVTDAEGMALLFSRSPIPYRVEPADAEGDEDSGGLHQMHVGVYAYRREVLLEIGRRPRGRLERAENLEQLRPLELGVRILTLPVAGRPPGGVDTPADLERLEQRGAGGHGRPPGGSP